MIDIKNISDGPRVLNSTPPIVLQAGEEREDIAITSAELASAEASGHFEIEGEADDDGLSEIGGDAVETARREIAEEAQRHIDGLRTEHAEALKVETDRADAAEKALAEAQTASKTEVDRLNERIAELESEIADRGPDPDLIRAAIEGLDPKNEDHWTTSGLPQVDAVKAALGADVSRAQISAAAPEAKRPA